MHVKYVQNWSLLTYCLLQFYPYGDSHGDTSLRYPYIGEGSSSVITLSQEFVFYGQVVRTAYVCLSHV